MASQTTKDACFCIGNKQYETFLPSNIKSTQLDECLVLITEPNILQVSLVDMNDNCTVMPRISVFKHPLIVHRIDAHF